MSYPLTDEQQAIVAAVDTGADVNGNAGAGTGKTSTSVAVVSTPRSKKMKIGYFVFNKKNQVEAEAKMPPHVSCKTFHSLAFSPYGATMKHRLNNNTRMRATDLAARMGLSAVNVRLTDGTVEEFHPVFLAGLVTQGLKRFAASDDAKPVKHHVPFTPVKVEADRFAVNDAIRAEVVPAMQRAWADIMSKGGSLPYEHDYYLKAMHLAVLRGEVAPRFDMVIVDEAQDSSPCRLAIARALGKQLVLIGDSNQMIYEWNGSVDVLTLPSTSHAVKLNLSQSFRFGPAVAEVANLCLGKLPTDLVLKGFDQLPTTINGDVEPNAILCRTNGGVLAQVIDNIDRKRTYVVGDVADLLKFVEGCADLQAGKRTTHSDLRIFSDWNDCTSIVASDDAFSDLRTMIKLVKDHGTGKLMTALRQCSDERGAELTISTIHKSKGAEWDNVRLAADIVAPQDTDLPAWRLLYVAVTRAQRNLDLSVCPAFTVTDGKVALAPYTPPESKKSKRG